MNQKVLLVIVSLITLHQHVNGTFNKIDVLNLPIGTLMRLYDHNEGQNCIIRRSINDGSSYLVQFEQSREQRIHPVDELKTPIGTNVFSSKYLFFLVCAKKI